MKGQSVIEYILLIGMLVTVLYVMAPAFKRAMQSVIKVTADQVGVQLNADQEFNSTSSFLNRSETNTVLSFDRTTLSQNYATRYLVNDLTDTSTKSQTNMGFSPQE